MKLIFRKYVWRVDDVRAHLRMPLYQNGYALIASSFATSGLGILYWVVAARLYSPEILGLNSALLAALAFLGAVAQLNLGSVLIRFLPAAGRVGPRLIVAVYAAAVGASVAAGLIFALITPRVFPALAFLQAEPRTLGAFIAATLAFAVFNLQDSVLAALKQTLWVPVENFIFAVAKILLLMFMADRALRYGIFASWTIPAGAAVLVVSIALWSRFIPNYLRARSFEAQPFARREILRFAGINYLAAIFFQAAINLLPMLVTAQAGLAANAYFYLPWTITLALQMIAYNMSISFTVEAAGDRAQLATLFRSTLRHNFKLYPVIVAVVFIGAPYLLGAFGANYAARGTTLLRLLAVATLPYSVVALAFGLARVQNRVGRVAVLQAVSCVLTLALSYALLPVMGITGVGAAWLVNQLAIAALLWFFEVRPFLRETRTERAIEASRVVQTQWQARSGKDRL